MVTRSSTSSAMMTVRSFFESEHYRVFIKEGAVMKTKADFADPSERYLFLCSDVLIIAQVCRDMIIQSRRGRGRKGERERETERDCFNIATSCSAHKSQPQDIQTQGASSPCACLDHRCRLTHWTEPSS